MYSKVPGAAVDLTAASLFIFCQLFLVSNVLGQAVVVDPVPLGGASSQQSRSVAPTSSGVSGDQAHLQAELYHQIQTLQQEVLQLRGTVDEQAHELKKLKQQRLDDYLDLDRRISQLSKSGPVASSSGSSGNNLAVTPGSGTAAPADELGRYRAAMDMLLKQQDQSGAIDALDQYLQDYPKGRYVANAQYWLGEAYLVKDDLEKARQWFSRLISEFPGHSKVPDAKFKLAKVYDLQGDKVKARGLLEDVAQSGASASSLARDYLENKL